MKKLTRWSCGNCENQTYYLEFDPNWNGMSVLKFTCTKCGCNPVWQRTTDVAKLVELNNIKRQLRELSPQEPKVK